MEHGKAALACKAIEAIEAIAPSKTAVHTVVCTSHGEIVVGWRSCEWPSCLRLLSV